MTEFLEKLEGEEHELPHPRKKETYHIHYIVINNELEKKIEKEAPNLWSACAIRESKPPNMEEEKEMFEKLFEVDVRLRPFMLYYTEGRGYRVCWMLGISGKEQCRRIVEGLGLPLHKHEDGE